MTFDDGTAAPETGTLLKYLAQHKARATFFVVGQNVAAHPDMVRAEMKSGHEIANHSWNRPVLTNLTPAQIRSRLERTNAAIKAATGKEPTLFRPHLRRDRQQSPGSHPPLPRPAGRGHRGLEVPRPRQGRPDRHHPGRAQRRRPDPRHPPHLGRRRPRDPAHPHRPRLPLRHRQPPARDPLSRREARRPHRSRSRKAREPRMRPCALQNGDRTRRRNLAVTY
ncbi:polysaccharide deacetylase family protein [Streptomyces sp. NPDC093591]|uniref:polysaccharide deacetylase family protein n=1 Tax=Streptomyces sp. NPDC093591 TaxID=3366044 RepID=UPI0037FC09F5